MSMTSEDGKMREWYIKALDAFPTSNHSKTNQAINGFLSQIPIGQPTASLYHISFLDGVLDVRTLERRREVREDYLINHMPMNIPSLDEPICPIWDRYITDLMLPPPSVNPEPGDHRQAIETLEAFLGYCLTSSYLYRNFLLLIGATSTGKSVLTQVLKHIFPEGGVSETSLEKFSEPNSLRTMLKSMVNISAEAGRQYFSDADKVILQITSGEKVEVRILYRDRFETVIPARLIVNGNSVPSFGDSSRAMEERMILLRTTDTAVVRRIPHYHNILLQEQEAIVARFILAYRRMLLDDKGFILPAYSVEEAKETTETSNSARLWMRDKTVLIDSWDTKTWRLSVDLYSDYFEWCKLNGHKAMTSNNWGKELATAKVLMERVRNGATGTRSIRRNLRLTSDIEGVEY
jgi:phage/plasmid-associated DNA primase